MSEATYYVCWYNLDTKNSGRSHSPVTERIAIRAAEQGAHLQRNFVFWVEDKNGNCVFGENPFKKVI